MLQNGNVTWGEKKKKHISLEQQRFGMHINNPLIIHQIKCYEHISKNRK